MPTIDNSSHQSSFGDGIIIVAPVPFFLYRTVQNVNFAKSNGRARDMARSRTSSAAWLPS